MVLIVVLNDANRIPKCEKNKKIQAEMKLHQLGKHVWTGRHVDLTCLNSGYMSGIDTRHRFQ